MKVREFNLPVSQILQGVEFDLFVSSHPSGNPDLSMFVVDTPPFPSFKSLQDGDIRIVNGIGVIFSLSLFDIGPSIGVVQFFHRVEFRLAEIDRPFIKGRMSAGKINLGNHLLFFPGGIDDDKVLLRGGPQAHPLCRVGILSPVPMPLHMMKGTLLLKIFQDLP